MSKKPLMNYTLAEAKTFCKARTRCAGCYFSRGVDFGCGLKDSNPSGWRFPAITENERELLRLTGAKYVSRDGSGPLKNFVLFWNNLPDRIKGDCFAPCDGLSSFGHLSVSLFPSIRPGVCWGVAKLLDEGEQTDG